MKLPKTKGTQSRSVPRKPQSFQLIFSEVLPSDTNLVEAAVSRLVEALVANNCVNGQCSAVEVALREALANAILHGNEKDSQKKVELDCLKHADGSVTLVVRDEGQGFDPASVPDPTLPENIYSASGRGIYLIRSFMDEVRFRRGGSEIRMKKNKP
ncbi:MAG TPA: ATP-binding protein [Candidatus Nitrosotenuis sp.]|nr:ATP-binding protein [Candidatus Nitrosotenuis sp.]